MCTELDQTGLSWSQPTLAADVMCQVPGLEAPILTENYQKSLVFQISADVRHSGTRNLHNYCHFPSISFWIIANGNFWLLLKYELLQM